MILTSQTYERAGNDAWLIDRIQIVNDEFGLSLQHKQRWTGWGGDINGDSSIELDRNDIDASQGIIDRFIEEHSLHTVYPSGTEEGIKINLKELLDNN